MYNTVLVPVDGSATSKKGLAEAVKLAKQVGSRLCIVHIVNEFVLDYNYGSTVYGNDIVESMRGTGKAILDEAVNEVRNSGVQAEGVLLETIGGPASDLIVQQAKASHADLIVMGTHGRRGLRRLALGSDAEEVVRTSSIPVLLVNVGAPPAAKGAYEQPPNVAALL